jgi:iron complex outermembrane receptor protein
VETSTDQFGTYRLNNLPSGPVELEFYYTGMDTYRATTVINSGAITEKDIMLTNAVQYGSKGGVLKLDSFVVAANREMGGQALAVNEQRYAGNIKNVLSSDTHGDVTEGNIAEFMKHMPGVVVNYGDANANSVSVRGLADNLTGVTIDGSPTASTAFSNSRTFQFTQVSINTMARIELTKVPLPSTPADSLAGSINMVSKSAFERSRAELNFRTYLTLNSDEFTLKKTAFPYEEYNYKAIPGFDLTYSKPVNKRFGFVITASGNVLYMPQDYSQTVWNVVGTSTNATPATPYLQTYQLIDAPKRVGRFNSGIKADWRVTNNSVLSLGLQFNYHRDDNANNTLTATAGTVGTPSVAGGTSLTYSPTTTVGATGRGSVTMSNGHHHYTGPLLMQNLRYRYDNGSWRVIAGISNSDSKSTFRYQSYGHFRSLAVSLRESARVTFSGIDGWKGPRIQAFNNNDQEIDIYNLNSYQLTNGSEALRDFRDRIKSADISVRRELNRTPFPVALEIGGSMREQTRDAKQPSVVYNYVGPDGSTSAVPYASQVYRTDSPFGFSNIPWVSPRRAFVAWEKDRSLFTMTPAQLVANEVSRISTSEFIKEDVTAAFVQADLKLFKNRLKVIGGLRYEKTDSDGLGPVFDSAAVFVRNPDGSFARTPDGLRIRKPQAGTAGSMEELRLTRQERGYRASKSYNGSYPSLHFNLNAASNLVVRLAWARTYGRPNFTEIIPNSTISESDVDLSVNPNQVRGTINIRNTGLRPWTADNFDLSIEYYTENGGVFSAGVFTKKIKDFFGAGSRISTAEDIAALGLNSRYLGWILNTKFNAGNATVSGAEINVSQSLKGLGKWGNHVQIFANGTKLDLDGGAAADWQGFTPEILNWGVTISKNPVTLMAKWQYRGESQSAPVAGLGTTDAFLVEGARTLLDLNLDYQLSPRLSLFANARNVFNVWYRTLAKGSLTPDYATIRNVRNYGTQYSIGIKGTF